MSTSRTQFGIRATKVGNAPVAATPASPLREGDAGVAATLRDSGETAIAPTGHRNVYSRRRNVYSRRRDVYSSRRGAVLITALIVTTVLAGMVLVLGRTMRVELQAAANQTASAQALSVERGAEQYLLALLVNEGGAGQGLDETLFRKYIGDTTTGGYFEVVRPDYGDRSLPLYGFVAESAKININSLNAAQRTQMLNLFDDQDTADAIVAWRDSREGGDSYYNSLPGSPYTCKQGPFETVEEILMVRGLNRELLYGNPLLQEQQRTSIQNNVGADGILDPMVQANGVYDLLTVYSVEPATDPDGSALTRANNRQRLQQFLSNRLPAARAQQIAGQIQGNNNFPSTPLAVYGRTDMTADELDLIADYMRVDLGNRPPIRIDVNEAPPAVLYTLVGVNGIQSADIDAIVSQRQSTVPEPGSIGWVGDAVGKAAATRLAPYLVARSYRLSADIRAYSGNGRAFKRVRIVIDANGTPAGTPPQILYRRDLTDKGMTQQDEQTMALLRNGQDPSGSSGSAYNGGVIR